ncbi:Nucleoid occlusion protein [subsurface metagenome]
MPGKLTFVSSADVSDTEYQTRLDITAESIKELTESIRRDGILVPLLMSFSGDVFTIIAGHRRFMAALDIGLAEVPAYVIPAEQNQGWSGAFAENMFRQNLTPIEESAAVLDCLESERFNHVELAKALGKSTQWVEDRINIAHWPRDVQKAVHGGWISTSAARNLAKIEDEPHRQMLLDFARENGATARVTAAWLQAWQAGQVHEDPAQITPAAGESALPPIEPYSPCVICARKMKMIELHFTPVCDDCSHLLIDLARELAARGVAGA